MNERITTSSGNNNAIKNTGVNLLQNYQQSGIPSFQNALNLTPNSQ